MSGQGTGPCPAFSFFFKTFEIIFLTIPAGHRPVRVPRGAHLVFPWFLVDSEAFREVLNRKFSNLYNKKGLLSVRMTKNILTV